MRAMECNVLGAAALVEEHHSGNSAAVPVSIILRVCLQCSCVHLEAFARLTFPTCCGSYP